MTNWTRPQFEPGDQKARVWELLVACAQGETAVVDGMLVLDPDLARADFAYYTPLHVAAREGHHGIVLRLLASGADATYNSGLGWQESPLGLVRDREMPEMVSLLTDSLQTAYETSMSAQELCQAVREGDAHRAEGLLRAMPHLANGADERGNRPLHWAAMTRRLDMLQLLLDRGADPNLTRADGCKPIHLLIHGDYFHRRSVVAVRDGSAVLGYLLARGAELDTGIAAHLGDIERVGRFVRENPANATARNSAGYRPLSYAARRGHEDIVRFLLESGADPNLSETGASHGLALYEAVAHNHAGCARALMEAGAHPNATVESSGNPLMRALGNGNEELIHLLYGHGGTAEMYHFLSEGRIDVVAEVLNANPEVANGGGDYGFLCMAAGFTPIPLLKLVLRHQPNLNQPWYANNYFGYAMDRARRTGSMEVLELLLSAGADVNLPNWMGVTYLHKAAFSSTPEIIALLLQHGANPASRDDDFESTPLGWAARAGRLDLVQALLENGVPAAEPEAPEWATPVRWAEKKGHEAVAIRLQEAAGVTHR